MKYAIQIPKPCHEPWEVMTPENNGRHCSQCNKTVVDFSGWNQEDIQEYLQQQGKTGVCGRFRTDQLSSVDTAFFVNSVAYSPMPLFKKIAAILLLAFGLVQMSCTDTQQQNTQQITGAITLPLPPEPQNYKPDTTVLGAPVIVNKKSRHCHTAKPRDTSYSATHTTGEVEYVQQTQQKSYSILSLLNIVSLL